MTVAVQEKKQVKIGEYVLTGKIGQGGIAEIYRAHQESLDRDVAIKILNSKLSKDPDIVRRFQRESLVVAKLNHPNIVHIIDKGQAGDRYFFVMEYVNGTSLKEVIESDRIARTTKLEMIVQVCKALDYAHKNGVIHRDIKPANVLIDRQGNAQVADFGIAQIVGATDTEVTATDVVMGTLAYMSPEQKVSSTNVDQTTDLYATGIMLYEVLTGKKPMGHFKLPTEADPTIDKRFDEIVQKCLASEPKDRFQSAVELKDAILDALGTEHNQDKKDDFSVTGSDSFLGKCRYLDTIKETRFSSTILVENKLNKQLYVIKKHAKGTAGRKEATLLKKLKHKNIVNIIGSGGDSKSTVIIAEYARGGSLADRMVRPHEWEKALEIILQVAAGLDHAHKNNIVHGNLRPSNVLFRADDEVAISDFGMPIHYDNARKRNWYSPPERKNSRQGDIYGMGVILHQLLTNRNPAYDKGNNLVVEDLRGFVPPEVCDILKRMLAIRVALRYRSCEEFLFDWDQFEQRRQDKLARQFEPEPESPDARSGGIPVWVYPVVAVGLIGLVFAVLYFSGFFT